jgi:hypothetical protein
VSSDASEWSMIGDLSSFLVPFPELSDGNTLISQLALISNHRITVLSQFLGHSRKRTPLHNDYEDKPFFDDQKHCNEWHQKKYNPLKKNRILAKNQKMFQSATSMVKKTRPLCPGRHNWSTVVFKCHKTGIN